MKKYCLFIDTKSLTWLFGNIFEWKWKKWHLIWAPRVYKQKKSGSNPRCCWHRCLLEGVLFRLGLRRKNWTRLVPGSRVSDWQSKKSFFILRNLFLLIGKTSEEHVLTLRWWCGRCRMLMGVAAAATHTPALMPSNGCGSPSRGCLLRRRVCTRRLRFQIFFVKAAEAPVLWWNVGDCSRFPLKWNYVFLLFLSFVFPSPTRILWNTQRPTCSSPLARCGSETT